MKLFVRVNGRKFFAQQGYRPSKERRLAANTSVRTSTGHRLTAPPSGTAYSGRNGFYYERAKDLLSGTDELEGFPA